METVLVGEYQIRRQRNGLVLWLNRKRSIELTDGEAKALAAEFGKQQTQVLGQMTLPPEVSVQCQYHNGLLTLKMRRQIALAMSNELTVRTTDRGPQ